MNMDYDQLNALRDEWQSLQPLTPENDSRLWKKLRLEWNYHSNHIEGNTLTYGETELLLIHDQTSGHHDHREFVEMKAHDLGIQYVIDLAADPSRLLSEGDIRDLNKIILKESFWKSAQTMDGKPTRKEIIPGQYKTTPNNVLTATGEIFSFASVEETGPKMKQLSEWLRQEIQAPTLHPVELAAKLHHDFVLIHPFDDGNGRVARLLVNYVLQRTGYLPVIVRTEDKSNYLATLRLADAGDLTPLTRYLEKLAEWSLKVGIQAAKGASIEEPSDVEKEIALFIRNQTAEKRDVIRCSSSVIVDLYNLGWKDLFERFEKKLILITKLFATADWDFNPKQNGMNDWRHAFGEFAPRMAKGQQLMLSARLGGYHGQAKSPFDANVHLCIQLEEFEYKVSFEIVCGTVNYGEQQVAKKLYSEPILADEAEKLTSDFLKRIFEEIKTQAAR